VSSVGVLVDVDDVDDVPAATGPPVQVHLAPGLDAVVQHLKSISKLNHSIIKRVLTLHSAVIHSNANNKLRSRVGRFKIKYFTLRANFCRFCLLKHCSTLPLMPSPRTLSEISKSSVIRDSFGVRPFMVINDKKTIENKFHGLFT